MTKSKPKNPKYLAQIALQDVIHPDNAFSLDKMQEKYDITGEQKEAMRKASIEFIETISQIIAKGIRDL